MSRSIQSASSLTCWTRSRNARSSERVAILKACHGTRAGGERPCRHGSLEGERGLGLELGVEGHVFLPVRAHDDDGRTAPCRVAEGLVEPDRHLVHGCDLDHIAPCGPGKVGDVDLLRGAEQPLEARLVELRRLRQKREYSASTVVQHDEHRGNRGLPPPAHERSRVVQEGEITEQADDRAACSG